MNDIVLSLYDRYLERIGDKAASASLALADVILAERPKAPAPADRPMTPKEVASRLRVTQDKVLRWIHTGDLPATNVASKPTGLPRYRISEADLAVFHQRRASITKQPDSPSRRITRRELRRPLPKPRHPTT